MSFISYAQNLEDVMLWRALKDIKNGFYIDVGANDPEIDSVTKAFYDCGWHGINIEPINAHYTELLKSRSRDINLKCAAGREPGELNIWQCDVRGWATMSEEVAKQHEKAGFAGFWETTKVETLTEICKKHAPDEIHFLKIDVEGFEFEVLQGMDFKLYRPWLVVVEATIPSSPEENYAIWESTLTQSNYVLAYTDGLNRFYLAKEREHLLSSFNYPPNVFDDFVSSQLLQAVTAAHSSQTHVEQLQAFAHRVESQAAAAGNRANELEEKNRLLLHDFQQERSEATARANSLTAQNILLQQQLQDIYLSRSWRMTYWLRWLRYQIATLRSQGLASRVRAVMRRLRNPSPDHSAPEVSITMPARSSTNPHLAMDMYVLGQGVKTGIYRVCDELFQRLAKRGEFDTRYLLRSNTHAGSVEYLRAHEMHAPQLTEDTPAPSQAVDILLSPFGVAPQAWRSDKKILHSHIIYDLIAIRRPELFTAEASAEVHQIIESLSPKTLIFAISEYTKQDLLDYRRDLSPEQVTVIPLAAGDQFKPCLDASRRAAVRARYSIPQGVPYLLSLATLEIRKNLNRVVESYVLYMNETPDSDLHLVLAGMSGWKLDSLSQSLSSAGRWRDRIILTGFVDDNDLSAIYSDALCFIYMSQYEGFGLPPLEAMACGTPVICSNNSSLPEVVGNAGVLIDAEDVASAANSIAAIATQPELRLKLSEQGLERAKLFTWEECENKTTEALLAFSSRKSLSPLSSTIGT